MQARAEAAAGAERWAPTRRARGTGWLIRHLGWRTWTSALLFAAAGTNLALTREHFAARPIRERPQPQPRAGDVLAHHERDRDPARHGATAAAEPARVP